MNNKPLLWMSIFLLVVNMAIAQQAIIGVQGDVLDELRSSIRTLATDFNITRAEAEQLWNDAGLDVFPVSFDDYMQGVTFGAAQPGSAPVPLQPPASATPVPLQPPASATPPVEGGGSKTTRNVSIGVVLAVVAGLVIWSVKKRRGKKEGTKELLDEATHVNSPTQSELSHYLEYLGNVEREKENISKKLHKIASRLKKQETDLIKKLGKSKIRDIAYLYDEDSQEYKTIDSEEKDAIQIIKLDRSLMEDVNTLSKIEVELQKRIGPLITLILEYKTNESTRNQTRRIGGELETEVNKIITTLTNLLKSNQDVVDAASRLRDLLQKSRREKLAQILKRREARKQLVLNLRNKFESANQDYSKLADMIKNQNDFISRLIVQVQAIVDFQKKMEHASVKTSVTALDDQTGNSIPIDSTTDIPLVRVLINRPFHVDVAIDAELEYETHLLKSPPNTNLERRQEGIRITFPEGINVGKSKTTLKITPKVPDIPEAHLDKLSRLQHIALEGYTPPRIKGVTVR